jgi:uncharacterized membrane protein
MLNRAVKLAAILGGGVWLGQQLRRRNEKAIGGEMRQSRRFGSHKGISTVEESIEVNVPVRTAYNQWTQFEDFPQFMASVHEVRQVDDTHLHWKATVGGKEKEWDAEIREQIPDTRIAWHSTSGAHNGGVVIFDKLHEGCTRIRLEMEYQPEGPLEKLGDMLGAMRLEARANLQKFKEMIEARGKETGAWRGEVAQPTRH